MFWLLTCGGVALGSLLTWKGLRRYFSRRLAPPTGRPDRFGRWLLGLGSVFLVVPDLFAALVVDYPGIFAGVALMFYRGMVLTGVAAAVLLGLVTSRRSVRAMRETTTTAVAVVPSLSARRVRREQGLADFPRSWDALLDYDRELCRRLLSYQHDLEQAANRPAMADYTDPLTRRAVEAMLACDRWRTEQAPLVRDVISTGYGRAVADFALALRAAEENASRQVQDGLRLDERDRLAEAARIIAFVQSNATTEADREQAYRKVAELMSVHEQIEGAAAGFAVTAGAGQHPWLSVTQRAELDELFTKRR